MSMSSYSTQENTASADDRSGAVQSGNQPSHIVWFVPERDNAPWTRIGVQWPTRNGNGFRQVLNFVPTGEGNIVVLPNEPKPDGENASA